MPITYINTGSSANAGDGDSIRTAFNKVNANFAFLNNISVTSSSQFYDILPAAENVYNLGNTATSWSRLYLDNGLVLKDNIISLNTVTKSLTINGVVVANTVVSADPPSFFNTGTTWFDTDSGALYVYYDGGWVQVVGSGGSGGGTNLLAVDTSILPRLSSTVDIGSNLKLWNNVYANTVYLGTSTLSVNAFNTLTFNGAAIYGPVGPQGPQGPGANQALNTTSTVTFATLTVTNGAFLQGNVSFTDNLIDLHAPTTGSTWTFSDGYDIGLRFRYYNGADTSAGLISDSQTNRLQYFSTAFNNVTTGTYTGTFGGIEAGDYYVKGTGIVFPDSSLQTFAFTGTATFAATSALATTATNVNGGTVRGSAVNGTTSTTQVGYLVIPQIRIDNTASYTLTLNDQGKHIYCVTATSQTIVIPSYASVNFPIGTAVTVIQKGAGTVNITTGSGVTLILAGADETGNRQLLSSGMITILNVENNIWFISGTGIV